MGNGQQIDAAKLIVAQLEGRLRKRRRQFLPALLIVVFALAGSVLVMGVRPDLLSQAWWQFGLQCVLWILGLMVLPAIGLGLAFPGRAARVGLVAGIVGLTILATLGLPNLAMFGPEPIICPSAAGCAIVLGVYAAMVLVVALVYGAFAQRQKTSAVVWIAGGISLAALAAITWHCPRTGAEHVVPGHLGPALAAMFAGSVLGALSHRRHNPRTSSSRSAPASTG